MILPDDSDKRVPPPPYPTTPPSSRRQRSSSGLNVKLFDLPPNILLQIVETTFPPDVEGERRNLYWLTISLRLVNRGLYIACMHILRSTYVETYLSLVRPPYTSDPFPMGSDYSESSIQSIQRETEALDLFIALKAREDVWMDETELHLEKKDSFNDLFALIQPRRRLEDLLRYYGHRYGFISLSDTLPSRSVIPFSQLSISFSTRKVGVVLLIPASRKTGLSKRTTILECRRDRNEKLEVIAKRLAKALGSWLANRE
ncbi:hypothetical protein K439DRAFT_1385097 [Ramaria rubella]|nr:hypothetical protein K439DRAFT_1385097 [Ramaria rubella]